METANPDTVLRLCVALRETLKAVEEAQYQLGRIMTADWGAEQMRLGAKSGDYQLRKALTKIRQEVDFT